VTASPAFPPARPSLFEIMLPAGILGVIVG